MKNKIWKEPLTIFLTEKCNKKCHYCDIPLISKPKSTNIEIIQKHRYVIEFCNKHNIQINLTGGELGLLSSDILEYIAQIYKSNLNIYTNGLFIEHHNDLIDKYKINVNYHIINFKNIKFHDNVTYNIIITSKNYKEVLTFINNNKHISLNLKFNRIKIENQNQNKLTKEIFDEILSIKSDNIKFTFSQPEFLYDVTNKKIQKIKLCNNYILMPQINLVKETIDKCCRAYIDMHNIKLNKENFNLTMCGFGHKLFNTNHMYVCDTCNINNLFSDADIRNIFKRRKFYE